MPSELNERLREYLSGLDKEQLVGRLLALAERDEVALTALRAEAAAAAGTFDLAGFRKELTARLRVSGFVDWRGAGDYARRVDGLLDVLESLIDGGRAADAVVLAEHVMARLDTAMGRIDDSGGHLGQITSRVADTHHAACVRARPDPKRLAVRLVEVALRSDWEWFLDAPQRYAEVLGEEGLAAYRARLEREWEALPPLLPSQRPHGSFDGRRFTVTQLRKSLARACGSIDELVSVLAHDLSSPFRFCEIADELERAGREREALVWLERGLAAFPPAGDGQLRARLVRAFLRDGQLEDAVALVKRAFDADRRRPPIGRFGRRRPACGTGRIGACWRWSLRALAEVPGSGGRYLAAGRSEAVRAQLEEGDVDGAWTDAQEGGCGMGLWHQLADARRAANPDDAVAVYRRLLDNALEQTDIRAYKEAVSLLREIRETLAGYGRAAELAADVERVRAGHRRRPKLMSMLAAEGW